MLECSFPRENRQRLCSDTACHPPCAAAFTLCCTNIILTTYNILCYHVNQYTANRYICWASLIGYGRAYGRAYAYGRAFANSRATLGHREDAERQDGKAQLTKAWQVGRTQMKPSRHSVPGVIKSPHKLFGKAQNELSRHLHVKADSACRCVKLASFN